MDPDEALAFAAWCLSEVPRLARTSWTTGRERMCVGFQCPIKFTEVLLGTFRSNCSGLEHRVYLNQTIDSVTMEFTWIAGTLRVDPWRTV